MKKRLLTHALALPALLLAVACTYAVCNQPEVPVREELSPAAASVEDPEASPDGFYDQFGDPADEEIDVLLDAGLAPPGERVLVVGDSEACAVGNYAADPSWRAEAGLGQPDDQVRVACKASTTVEYWADGRLERAMDDFDPDAVVVFLGTNHWGAQKAPDVEPILQLFLARGARCLWVGNTAVRGKHWAINGLLREAVGPTCAYFDTEAAGVVLADGIHPGPAAAQRWLKDVWRSIPQKDSGE